MGSLILLIILVQSAFGLQHTLSGVAWSYDSNASTVINQWVGEDLPLVQVYDTFCGFWVYQYMTPFWNVRNIPMFSFQPTQLDCKSDSGNTAEKIANGEQDSYLNQWLNVTKQWLAGPNGVYGDGDDRRMYLRFAHEMNGNWYPWSGNTTAYVLAWQRFWKMTTVNWKINSTRIQWVWNVNANDVGGIKAESYYPGDEYVDWISVDGYNNAKSDSWSSWQTPQQVFGDMLSRFAALAPKKPIGIPETGCSTSGYTAEDKYLWITQVYDYALQNNIKFVMWFNIEGGYTDYAIFGSRNGTTTYISPINNQHYLVYDSYVQAVKSSWLPIDPKNPRILTDDEFAGNFT